MQLYDESIEVDIPVRYKDISQLIAAQKYQYMFACDAQDTDNFLIVDLMQPVAEVDLHMEDILGMNDVEAPRIVSVVYTCEQFMKSINMFLARYKSKVIPERIENPSESLEWVSALIEGRVTRSDGVQRYIQIVVSIMKHSLSDIVISIFKEGNIREEEKEEILRMNRSVRVLNPCIFTP
ncbi:hypothetical protein NEFER03_0602 [Nematocida sp. LUAm3]|nr:hypothetical protein NEFER03_0602 [Nematocida sp. LUAm3]KAI5175569.1 hypothetical protein NEFER02_1475 [Nematocida sp. LUAm2]KAI5178401.1 hypothetical protein NEFER01_1548 [Nematocida sp. LUAm1]